MALQTQTRRSFGADDRPICVRCGKATDLSRRGPHSEHPGYERQTFSCIHCDYESERSANKTGDPLR